MVTHSRGSADHVPLYGIAYIHPAYWTVFQASTSDAVSYMFNIDE